MNTQTNNTEFTTLVWNSPMGAVIGKILYATGAGLNRVFMIETIDGNYKVSVMDCGDFQ